MTASDRAKYDLPEAPRRTETLETIAPDLRSCYVEASGGGYRLSPAAEAAQNEHAETCAAIEAEASEALAAMCAV